MTFTRAEILDAFIHAINEYANCQVFTVKYTGFMYIIYQFNKEFSSGYIENKKQYITSLNLLAHELLCMRE